jgi:hypothetical protein
MHGSHRSRPNWPDVERNVMMLLGIVNEVVQVIKAIRGL